MLDEDTLIQNITLGNRGISRTRNKDTNTSMPQMAKLLGLNYWIDLPILSQHGKLQSFFSFFLALSKTNQNILL